MRTTIDERPRLAYSADAVEAVGIFYDGLALGSS